MRRLPEMVHVVYVTSKDKHLELMFILLVSHWVNTNISKQAKVLVSRSHQTWKGHGNFPIDRTFLLNHIQP